MKSNLNKINFKVEKLTDYIFLFTGHSISLFSAFLLAGIWIADQHIRTTDDFTHVVITVSPFVLLFVIQKWQNKFFLSIQLKLNELIATQEGASNRLINIESLSENDLRKLAEIYNRMQQLHDIEKLNPSHSVEIEIEKIEKDIIKTSED